MNRSLAPTTAASYRVGIRRYLSFCHKLRVQPIPASKHQMAAFVTHLWPTITLQTIRVYLAGVSFLHHVEGLWSPVSGNPTLRLLLRGIRRSQVTSFPPRRYRQPITPRILARLLKSARDSRSLKQQDRQMFQATMSLAFFGVGEWESSRPFPSTPPRCPEGTSSWLSTYSKSE